MSLTKDAEAILWIDLETTGTDEALDEILEIGAIVTDFEFTNIGQRQTVIPISMHGLERVKSVPVVYDMHTTNNLLVECEHASPINYDQDLHDWVRKFVPTGKTLLAGSGISHFDRRFIRKYMPLTDALTVYPVLDIGTVRRFFRYCGFDSLRTPFDPATKTHRALDDIQAHLWEARHYKDKIHELLSLR